MTKKSNLQGLMQNITENMDNNTLPEISDNDQLNFTCTKCGKCCNNIEITLSIYDLYVLAEGLNKGIVQTIEDHCVLYRGSTSNLPVLQLKQALNGECEFLKNHKCSVHTHSPRVCKLYPVGSGLVFEDKSDEPKQIYFKVNEISKQTCPGIGLAGEIFKNFKDRNNLVKYEKASIVWSTKYAKWQTKFDLEKMDGKTFATLCQFLFDYPDLMLQEYKTKKYNYFASLSDQIELLFNKSEDINTTVLTMAFRAAEEFLINTIGEK